MTQAAATVKEGSAGIGGWLILPLLGLVVIALAGIRLVWITISNWQSLLSIYFDPAMPASITQLGMARSIFTVIVWAAIPLIVLLLLLRKDRRFPWTYIAWTSLFTLGAWALWAIDWWNWALAYQLATAPIVPLIWTAIWTPYMLRSVRVRNTFVN